MYNKIIERSSDVNFLIDFLQENKEDITRIMEMIENVYVVIATIGILTRGIIIILVVVNIVNVTYLKNMKKISKLNFKKTIGGEYE